MIPPNLDMAAFDRAKHCRWCGRQEPTNTDPCICDEPCGRDGCPQNLEQYIPPPVPRFK